MSPRFPIQTAGRMRLPSAVAGGLGRQQEFGVGHVTIANACLCREGCESVDEAGNWLQV